MNIVVLNRLIFVALAFWSCAVPPSHCIAQEPQQSNSDAAKHEFVLIEHPIAIFAFKARGREVEGQGEKVADLMFAKMAADPSLLLVDREDMEKILDEAELSVSALVNPNEAIQIGQLTGAKLLVTGSVFKVDDSTYVVAKLIGTETSRVVGTSVKGGNNDSLDEIVNRASDKIVTAIKENSDSLVAEQMNREDRIKEVKKQLINRRLPKVSVSIEEKHVGQTAFDPAAETELMTILKECGFEVVDREQGSEKTAELLITGEGISEFSTRTGNLVSVRARLELKVVDRKSGDVIAIDRQARMAAGLAEQIAGKEALESCAADIAWRVVPSLVREEE